LELKCPKLYACNHSFYMQSTITSYVAQDKRGQCSAAMATGKILVCNIFHVKLRAEINFRIWEIIQPRSSMWCFIPILSCPMQATRHLDGRNLVPLLLMKLERIWENLFKINFFSSNLSIFLSFFFVYGRYSFVVG